MFEERLKLYDAIIDTIPGIERLGKNMIYTSSNGYMYSMVNKDGEIGIRLPKERQKQLMNEIGATEFRSHGARMRDYVKLPDDFLEQHEQIAGLLKEGLAFVNSLPPKPEKKKK